MNGIPLQYLNGIDAGAAGLGKEFDTLETTLSGINDMEGIGFAHFRRALHQHVRNTRNKIYSTPNAVEAAYDPTELGRMYDELDQAFAGDDEILMGVLEDLAAREHSVLRNRFQNSQNAIHRHDDHLYGALFGDIDDQMINAFSGLGRKDRSAKKRARAEKKGKSGPMTKIKNAVVKAKKATKNAGASTKKVLKKIGKAVVKHNPVAISARLSFLAAMRTNFGKIAEKMYWVYMGKQFALSKGVSLEFYNNCVKLHSKASHIFLSVLKGDESALKKAVLNGRAAKKIKSQLEKRGMNGTEVLMGLSGADGLGVTPGEIQAAASLIQPLIDMITSLFKGKGSGIDNGEGEGDDDSVEAANRANDEEESTDNSEAGSSNKSSGKGGNTGLILGGAALAVTALVVMSRGKKPEVAK